MTCQWKSWLTAVLSFTTPLPNLAGKVAANITQFAG